MDHDCLLSNSRLECCLQANAECVFVGEIQMHESSFRFKCVRKHASRMLLSEQCYAFHVVHNLYCFFCFFKCHSLKTPQVSSVQEELLGKPD